jgi:hypothetical protein
MGRFGTEGVEVRSHAYRHQPSIKYSAKATISPLNDLPKGAGVYDQKVWRKVQYLGDARARSTKCSVTTSAYSCRAPTSYGVEPVFGLTEPAYSTTVQGTPKHPLTVAGRAVGPMASIAVQQCQVEA